VTLRSISREDLAELPIRRYEGDVLLVETPEALERATEDLRSERIVGFDTETRPSFRRGEVHLPCLVQAATARAVYLFPLRQPEVFPLIIELLESETAVKAGVAVADDLRALTQVFRFQHRNVVDVGVLAKRAGLEQSGVRNLAGLLLGYRIPKGNRTSNWAARQLTEAQITYAATDAWACRELYLKLA
jgi:ribonuclease D